VIEIVLYEPEIPQNTGSVARLCAGADIRLHLVEPLGFSLSDRYLKRAGLDYWPHVKLSVWRDFAAFLDSRDSPGRLVLTTSGNRGHEGTPYHRFAFRPGDLLVFGPESKGLPESLLTAGHPAVRIPVTRYIRSHNLANAASILLYEALRQLDALPA
jgi:tRNA (cytidine/uridine-2'-O-)-methyltransferase